MRINKFIAQASGLSRRTADAAITQQRVLIDGQPATPGVEIDSQRVTLDGKVLHVSSQTTTIMLNKPVGFVVSRNGQGSKTIYDLLPQNLHQLKPVGRLDKDSSGLLLLTNDGELANQLTHPSHRKLKVYEITLGTPLQPLHRQMINDIGINLEDGNSKLQLERIAEGDDRRWRIHMYEGRNRQIRRTFTSLRYQVVHLHRTAFGPYQLGDLKSGAIQVTV